MDDVFRSLMSLQVTLSHLRISHADQTRTKKKTRRTQGQNWKYGIFEHKYSNTEAPFIYVLFLIHIFILKKENHQNLFDTSGDLDLILSYRCSDILTYLFSYLLTYFLTPFSRVLLEKLTAFQLLKKFPAFYGTRRFLTVLTSARHLSLSWARSIQSIPPHPTSWRSILILSSHQCLGLASGVFPSGFPTKTLYTPLHSPYILHKGPPISFFSILLPAQYWVRGTDH